MATLRWKAEEYVYDIMRAHIAASFPDLALVDKKIAILFREKASKNAGIPNLGKSSKAPDILVPFLGEDEEYEFIIEIANDEWANLTALQQEALIFHHLCALSVTEDEETHEIKCGIIPPDVVAYSDEVTKYGVWRPVYDPEARKDKDDDGKGGRDKTAEVGLVN